MTPQASLRILLAEDDPINGEVAAALLGRMGHSVSLAADGLAAVDLFAQGEFDLVLMDLQMPGLDGFEAFERIRASGPAGSRVPVLAITASLRDAECEACRNIGMIGPIAKPLGMKSLAAALAGIAMAPPKTERDEMAEGLALAVVDLGTIADLRRDIDPEMVDEILDAFAAEVGPRTSGLLAAIGTGDWEQANQRSHSLKGASSNLGFRRMAWIAGLIHHRCRNNQTDGLDSLCPALERISDETIAALKALRTA